MMRRMGVFITAAALLLSAVLLCGAAPARDPDSEMLILPRPADGWQDTYLGFLENNYDVFTALWPDGMSGVGFIDLDLDGTPEMAVFDQGASAAMGVQLFDIVDGQVCCVSSTLDSAGGAFGSEHLSPVSVCTGFFESFRLSRTVNGWCFWVNSANGTMETAWDEIVRFDNVDGVLTTVSVCDRYLEFDPSSGLVVTERYAVGGAAADGAAHARAAEVYMDGQDTGYDAAGRFLWDDLERYDTSLEGFMTMARDAAGAYRPITDYVAMAALQP